MNKLLRSLLVLISFAPLALFGGSVYPYINSGEHIDIFVDGDVSGKVTVTNNDNGRLVAVVYATTTSSGSYNYSGSVSYGGSFVVHSSYGSIVGLPAGNYTIEANATTDMMEDNVYESGNSFYIEQRGYNYNGFIGFTLDIW